MPVKLPVAVEGVPALAPLSDALKEVMVKVLPEETFMGFMKAKGKEGGQHKFPRVLKGAMLKDWQLFLQGKSSD